MAKGKGGPPSPAKGKGKGSIEIAADPTEPVRTIQANSDYQPHYLVSYNKSQWPACLVEDCTMLFYWLSHFFFPQVGLLNYPNSAVPDILSGHTSGTLLGDAYGPYDYIPSVGFSDIEQYYDEENNKVIGEYFCLSDNGYGSSDNSADYALNIVHMSLRKPFSYRHGQSEFEQYTEATNLGTALIHDPHGFIAWENGADIQVEYAVPDKTWDDYKELRVLTGRDFDVEGLAVLNHECAIVGDELMPAIFAVNPTTGVVKSNFVRTPDIDEDGNFNGKFLSTRGDKVHCHLSDLKKNECSSVASEVVDESMYRKHDPVR